jgi:hypothetical protein
MIMVLAEFIVQPSAYFKQCCLSFLGQSDHIQGERSRMCLLLFLCKQHLQQHGHTTSLSYLQQHEKPNLVTMAMQEGRCHSLPKHELAVQAMPDDEA